MATLVRETGLDLKDVALIPQKSTIASPREVCLDTQVGHMKLKLPFVFRSVGRIFTVDEVLEVAKRGGLPIVDGMRPFGAVNSAIEACQKAGVSFAVSKPASLSDLKTLLSIGVEAICVNAADGHSENTLRAVSQCRDLGFKTVIASGALTSYAVKDLHAAGANVVRVGTGPIFGKDTRARTGVGYPSFDSLTDAVEAVSDRGGSVIASVPLTGPGDVAVALAIGAVAVEVDGLEGFGYGHSLHCALEDVEISIRQAMCMTGARTLTEFREESYLARI